jgi:hypothetical protein
VTQDSLVASPTTGRPKRPPVDSAESSRGMTTGFFQIAHPSLGTISGRRTCSGAASWRLIVPGWQSTICNRPEIIKKSWPIQPGILAPCSTRERVPIELVALINFKGCRRGATHERNSLRCQ